MENIQKFFREIDLFDFTSFFGLDFLKFSGPLWKDYYEIRDGPEDRAQSYCDLCERLNNPDEPPKIYTDMYKWWITDSHCFEYGGAGGKPTIKL